jgi:hypothetical protein
MLVAVPHAHADVIMGALTRKLTCGSTLHSSLRITFAASRHPTTNPQRFAGGGLSPDCFVVCSVVVVVVPPGVLTVFSVLFVVLSAQPASVPKNRLTPSRRNWMRLIDHS